MTNDLADWIHWVRWCNSQLPQDALDELVLSLIDLAQSSQFANPVLSNHIEREGHRAAGYLSMYPGALGVLGNLRCELDPNASTESAQDTELELLATVTRNLGELAIAQGAEMVQAISDLPLGELVAQPVERDDSTSDGSKHDRVLQMGGFVSLAKLVQMERSLRDESVRPSSKSITTSPFQLVPYDQMPAAEWIALVDQTYVGTLDVPELNGLRTTKSTLDGYASAMHGEPLRWWSILFEDQTIGCLLLSPLDRDCELTYVGLVPTMRNLGHSKQIMDHAIEWCRSKGMTRMNLAVDVRNTPAIKAYMASGFNATRFIRAWLYQP
jgi:GNAT superfamily N-acetyltransferase